MGERIPARRSPARSGVPRPGGAHRARLASGTGTDPHRTGGAGRVHGRPGASARAHLDDLIQAFAKKTGIPVILNTSFNENEPIVCKPDEAIDCFQRTRMDVLAIGPFLVVKPSGNAP